MYSIQWLMKGIDEANIVDVPRSLLYAAHPKLIFSELEDAKEAFGKIAKMAEGEHVTRKVIEMNASLKRTKTTIERALKYISCLLTRRCVDTVLNEMTILQAELVTKYLGVSP